MVNRAATVRGCFQSPGIRNAKEDEQGFQKGMRLRGRYPQDACWGVLLPESFPTDVVQRHLICTTAGSGTESSLLLESLCRIDWIGLFPSLSQQVNETNVVFVPSIHRTSPEGDFVLSTCAYA